MNPLAFAFGWTMRSVATLCVLLLSCLLASADVYDVNGGQDPLLLLRTNEESGQVVQAFAESARIMALVVRPPVGAEGDAKLGQFRDIVYIMSYMDRLDELKRLCASDAEVYGPHHMEISRIVTEAAKQLFDPVGAALQNVAEAQQTGGTSVYCARPDAFEDRWKRPLTTGEKKSLDSALHLLGSDVAVDQLVNGCFMDAGADPVYLRRIVEPRMDSWRRVGALLASDKYVAFYWPPKTLGVVPSGAEPAKVFSYLRWCRREDGTWRLASWGLP